ncbi:MAG: prepilin peptidase [Lachnospiraceae bacterium]|nr:prepilin peptidase [Lachnospiraceae bacterium]MCR5025580.1 prepilin peptidase [Lachnospiraceae bacterium]
MAANMILGTFLGICSYTDIRKKVVYVKVIVPFLLIGILLCISPLGNGIHNALYGTVVGLAILILSFATNGAVGEGDGLVLMITGFYLGFLNNIRLLCMALFLSAIVSVAAVILGKWGKKTELPFMPFLLISFLIIKVQEILP